MYGLNLLENGLRRRFNPLYEEYAPHGYHFVMHSFILGQQLVDHHNMPTQFKDMHPTT